MGSILNWVEDSLLHEDSVNHTVIPSNTALYILTLLDTNIL